MIKAFSSLSSYKLPIVIAFSLMLVELIIELASPIIIARIIDDGIQLGNLSQITYWGIILLILAAIAFAAGILNSYFSSHVSQDRKSTRLNSSHVAISYAVFCL